MTALPPNDLVPAGLPPLPAPAAGPPMSRRRKAAIVVRFLLSEGARLPLDGLPLDLQVALTRELAGMRAIDRSTLESVVAEFTDEVDALGLAFPDGLEDALEILDGSISDTAARRLRQQSGLSQRGDPWDTVTGLDPNRLLPVLESESVEVAAVLLSKLKVSVAAELLSLLPGERARRITYAVSRTGGISPQAVQTIGRALAAQLDTDRATAFSSGPVDRVGAILNFAPSATREDVLTGLDETDGAFAEQVRRAIFTFANIPARIDARDIPKIIRDMDQSALVRALAAAADGPNEAAAEFILANMSQRMADTLREEAREVGKLTPAEADAAMTDVVGVIRALEAQGEIFLLAEDG